MSAFTIPRKEVGEPSPAHLKETGNNSSDDSGWDLPEEGQQQRRNAKAGTATTAWKSTLAARFDSALPPHKRYFGRISRRTLLVIMLAAFLCLLALIIGLAVGLGGGKDRYCHTSSNSLHTR
jgi:hypothetical protein